MITREYLLETFNYDPNIGVLYWKVSRSNRVKIGDPVSYINNKGYLSVRLLGRQYLVHRLVWFLENKEWPERLDHKDGNRLNNQIDNLRTATSSQNNANRVKKSGATSTYKGVYWHKQRRKWHVQLSLNKKSISCGLFESEEEAALAYNLKALELHGEFTKLNKIQEANRPVM